MNTTARHLLSVLRRAKSITSVALCNLALSVGLLIASLAIGVPVSRADVTFYDGTFNDSDWTAVQIPYTPAAQSATFTASQVLTGGNPGAYRFITQTYTG